jgi:hypothetical protein
VVFHVPPQEIGCLVVSTSFDIANDLVRHFWRNRLHVIEQFIGDLIEAVDVKLEFLCGIFDGLLDGYAARVDKNRDNAVDITMFLNT